MGTGDHGTMSMVVFLEAKNNLRPSFFLKTRFKNRNKKLMLLCLATLVIMKTEGDSNRHRGQVTPPPVRLS
jgi:hypothetical protein